VQAGWDARIRPPSDNLDVKRTRILQGALKRYTEYTIVDQAALETELARVRAWGFAVDNLEFSLDLRCVAAPVFDRNGDVVCGIGMSAPALRFPSESVPGWRHWSCAKPR